MLSYSLGERNILNPAHDVFFVYKRDHTTRERTGRFGIGRMGRVGGRFNEVLVLG